MKTKLVMHRNHDANDGGGSAEEPLTISAILNQQTGDLDDESNNPPGDNPGDNPGEDPKGGSGGAPAAQSAANLSEEEQAAAAAAAAAKGSTDGKGDDDDDQLTDEERLAREEAALEFVSEVEEALGQELDLEDDFIPTDLTPPEISKLIRGVQSKSQMAGAEGLENYIKTELQPAYEYMLYLQNGGDPDKFFESKPSEVHTEAEVSENIELQKQYIAGKFSSKGLGQTEINALIKTYETDGLLKEQALLARTEADNARQDYARNLENSIKAAKAKALEIQQNLIDTADSILKTGKLGLFQIPAEDRPGFIEAFSKAVEISPDGKIYIKTEVTDQTINEVLQKEFLGYKKGDLSKIVDVKVKTAQVRSLKERLTELKAKQGSASRGGGGAGGGNNKPVGALSDLFQALGGDDKE